MSEQELPSNYFVEFYQGLVVNKLSLGVPRVFLILLGTITVYLAAAQKLFFVIPVSLVLYFIVRYFYTYDENFVEVAMRYFELKRYYHG